MSPSPLEFMDPAIYNSSYLNDKVDPSMPFANDPQKIVGYVCAWSMALTSQRLRVLPSHHRLPAAESVAPGRVGQLCLADAPRLVADPPSADI